MTDKAGSDNTRQFVIRSIYMKDLSFESPNTPLLFREEWKPEITLHFDIKPQQLSPDTHEIILVVRVTAKLKDKVAYIVEIQQAGIFSVQGFPEQELNPLFYVYCPSVLYPYARQGIADLVIKGGFPHLTLQHVQFDQVYAQKLQEQKAAQQKQAEENSDADAMTKH
jgi:preprotein translocase subunit SecB